MVRGASSIGLALLLAQATNAATVGPGLGNLCYSAAELFQPVSSIASPLGHGNVAMVGGYLMVVYSEDGFAGYSGIEF